MADSIVRLRVESQEYDAKLKRATEGLTRYADECRKVGDTLEVVEQDTLEYVRSLGQMDTASRTATGKLAEMKKAFVELKTQYNQMTEAEKASPFGQALGQSLEQLKGRIKESESALKGVQGEVNGTGGVLEALAGKVGLNVGQLTKFGGALAAAKGAMELAKGVIESTEATHDAFAKAVEVSDSITNQFLRSMANADFSNFINGMQGVIDKTVAAYEAMDEFESYAARFQPWQQAKESEIQTKLMQARAAKAQGDNKKAELLNAEAKTLIDQLATSTKAYGEKQTKGGFSTIRSLMGPVEISDRQIAWYADPKNWDEAIRKAEKFAALQEKAQKGTFMSATTAQRSAGQAAQAEIDRNPSLKRAYTMMNLRDSGDSKQAQQFRRALGDIYGNTLAESRIESLRARADRMDGVISGAGRRGAASGSSTTPQDKAGDIVSKAEAEYAATLDKIAVRREAGLDTALQAKQKEVAATEKLYDAYTSAYNTYADPTYKEMSTFTASMLSALAGKVNEAKDAQDAEKQAAQQLAEAEKKKAREMEQQKLMGTFSESGISAGIGYLKGKKAEAVIGSAEYKNFDTQLTDATTMGTLTGVMDKYNITPDQINVDAAGIWQKIINGNDIANADWQGVTDAINEKLKEMGIEPIKVDLDVNGAKNLNEVGKETKGTWKDAAGAVGQFGSALASLEDPSAKVAGIVMQSIANVALSFSKALSETAGPWDWIAASIAGTAAMISTISAIHGATGYAEGGVIPGNSFSGDNQLARVNAGELILSKSAQANLANQLDNPALPGDGGGDRVPYLRNDDIYLGLVTYGRKHGLGNPVFARG